MTLALRRSSALWAIAIFAVGLAVALPDPVQLAVGLVGLAAVIAAFIQPLAIMPLVAFAIPFGSILRGQPTADETQQTAELAVGATDILVALLGAAWLAHGIRRRRIDIHTGGLVAALLALVGLALLSVGYADDRVSAIKESAKWIELLLVLLVVVDLVRQQAAALWVVAPLFLAGAAEATYGAIQFATGSGPQTFELQGTLRAFGHFDQPNPFAGYLTTILPLALLMAVSGSNPTWFRGLSLGVAALLAVGIGLSQSRGAWLGAAFAFLTLVIVWSRHTRKLLAPAALLGSIVLTMALAGLLPPSVLDRVAQAVAYFGVFDVTTVETTGENFAVVERMAHWQAGWNMFVDHPWFGVGAGNYADAYDRYFLRGWPEALGHAHNYYLNMLAELGVLGGAALLAILALTFRTLGSPLLRSAAGGSSFWRALLAGAIGGLVVFCVHNLFDSLFVHGVQIQIGILLGLGLAAARHLRDTVGHVRAT